MTANEQPRAAADAPVFTMHRDRRRHRLVTDSEVKRLETHLEYHRDTLLLLVSGLSEARLRKVWTPSGLSLLGLVKHLAHVEHNWLLHSYDGAPLLEARAEDDPREFFRIGPDETAESVLAFYRRTIERAQQIIDEAEASLATADDPKRRAGLRLALHYLIEMTARHVGHADVMRELTDGHVDE